MYKLLIFFLCAAITTSAQETLMLRSPSVSNDKIENVRISRLEVLPPEDLTQEISLDVPAEVDWYLKDAGRQTFRGEIHLIRFSPADAWKVDSQPFIKENHF